jgi:hypothetical protein
MILGRLLTALFDRGVVFRDDLELPARRSLSERAAARPSAATIAPAQKLGAM